MRVQRQKLAASAVILVVAALMASAWGLASQKSDLAQTIEDDPTWLSYLPADEPEIEISLTGLNYLQTEPTPIRRVDWLLGSGTDTVSLCFAKSKEALAAGCPGFTYLGMSSRPGIELRSVAALGTTSGTDWLPLLSVRAPSLDDISRFT